MNNLQIISGVSCYEENGTAYLRLEDVARGLGFTETAASGNECVKWSRVRKYLADLGVDTCVDGHLPEYIPENIYVYRDKRGRLMPYAQHVEKGLFQIKEQVSQKTQWAGTQTLITPKGRETFRLLVK